MKKVRFVGIVLALVMALAISASALDTVFTSKTVNNYVYINQTKCETSDGTTVSAIYYLYNSTGDYSTNTLQGAETGNVYAKAAYRGTAHSLYVEKGSGVKMSYTYSRY